MAARSSQAAQKLDLSRAARKFGLSREHLKVILKDGQEALDSALTVVIHEKSRELEVRSRVSSPVVLRSIEIEAVAINCAEVVRERLGRLAQVLGEAVGIHSGFGHNQRQLMLRLIGSLAEKNASPEATAHLFALLTDGLELQDRANAATVFSEHFAGSVLSPLGLRHADAALNRFSQCRWLTC